MTPCDSLRADHDRLAKKSRRLLMERNDRTVEQARELALEDPDVEASPLARYWFAHGAELTDLVEEYAEDALEELNSCPLFVLVVPAGVAADLRSFKPKFVPGVEPGYCLSYAADPCLPETVTPVG